MTTVSQPRVPKPYHSHSHAEADYVCGAIASLANIMLTFPINKIMFRQQVHGFRVHKAFHQLRREGAANVFRGLLPPLLQRTATVSIMFGSYTNYKDALEDHFPKLPYLVMHTIAASGAGATEVILAPFERIQVVLQVKDFHGQLQNTWHTFRVLVPHGPREFYRGTSAILLRNCSSNVLFLGLRGPLKRSLPEPESEVGETMNAFISGAGLGACLSTIFFPLNVVKNRMQARVGGPFLGIVSTFHTIYEERGYRWRKMFRGVHVNYTRSFLSWGIINATYEFLKRHLRF